MGITHNAEPNNTTGQGSTVQPVDYSHDGTLRLVDQTLLPLRFERITCRSVEDLANAIRTLQVRGAPAIGVAAAYGLCLASQISPAPDAPSLLADISSAAEELRRTRPTAVNLAWALDAVLAAARSAPKDVQVIREAVYQAATRIDEQNRDANARIGRFGADLLPDGANILTHCNTGPLAAGGIGTALGLIYTAHRQGKRVHVWVDETRPLLQGARLTAWELGRWGVPATLIADNMAASLMHAGKVDAVLVGSDRIAANGDVANKIGTYGLAVLARAHDVPFYAIAPTSTVDLGMPSGDRIKIEERHADEITHHGGRRYAPEGVAVYNPAFDVTPFSLVTCIITESGVLRPPFKESLERACKAPGSTWQSSHSETPAAQGVPIAAEGGTSL